MAAAKEDVLMRSMTIETCGEVLRWSEGSGGLLLPRAVGSARRLELSRFGELSRSEGFSALSEDILCSLVGADELAAENTVLQWGW